MPLTPWPHASTHQLTTAGTYIVTAATYQKAHFFCRPNLLHRLQHELLMLLQEFGWAIEAWAVFSNHYHFVAHSPDNAEDAAGLSRMLYQLHRRTALIVNQQDNTPDRRVWYNFWDTLLSHHNSYLARLNYVHQNPVKHQLVTAANQYPWCSAGWFERVVSPAMVKCIYKFKTDKMNVRDDFAPIVEN